MNRTERLHEEVFHFHVNFKDAIMTVVRIIESSQQRDKRNVRIVNPIVQNTFLPAANIPPDGFSLSNYGVIPRLVLNSRFVEYDRPEFPYIRIFRIQPDTRNARIVIYKRLERIERLHIELNQAGCVLLPAAFQIFLDIFIRNRKLC
ncbi:hypothetical protein D3C84_730840 [compost metagenome]